MKKIIITFLVFIVLLTTACSKENVIARQFENSMNEHDYEMVWNMLTPELRATGNKEIFLENMHDSYDDESFNLQRTVTLTDNPNKFYGEYDTPFTDDWSIAFVKIDDVWYVNSFSGYMKMDLNPWK